ncbi:MAG: class I SAM-dependent methyltransferase [Saprospiraceae bacterium]|nr:class I SAM-dependent methyltransferase [Saprospiraceae bacterium]
MFLSKEVKAKLRAGIFRHLDGIATGPSAMALHEAGIIDKLVDQGEALLSDLTRDFKANEGYLNVALRVLASQGWLTQEILGHGEDVRFSITDTGKIAATMLDQYAQPVAFIPHATHLGEYLREGFPSQAYHAMQRLFAHYNELNQDDVYADALTTQVQKQILKHVEGLIVGPIIVALGINGMFHQYFSIAPFEVEEFTPHHKEVREIIEFLTSIDWFTKNGNVYNFTTEGLFYARRATAYGVTVSYLPAFARVRELLFGNPRIFWDRPAGSTEIHVDRLMNVWGSGGAHTAYFKQIDQIVTELFNRPIHDQPKGFLDMGCGNGTLLEHIFDVIWKQTERGKMLEEYPLFIVGADFNEKALLATRETLNRAGIWAKVVFGDVGKPELLAESLQEKYNIFLGDLLNVRSFLDHNRVYAPPQTIDEAWVSNSSGAFAFRGERIPNHIIEQNLVDHLRKWSPYVQRFGLLVMELHTIDPTLTAANLGKVAATAYDATHGYSDQYILELDCFLKAAELAGLKPDPSFRKRYPDSELATISLNLLRG